MGRLYILNLCFVFGFFLLITRRPNITTNPARFDTEQSGRIPISVLVTLETVWGACLCCNSQPVPSLINLNALYMLFDKVKYNGYS